MHYPRFKHIKTLMCEDMLRYKTILIELNGPSLTPKAST